MLSLHASSSPALTFQCSTSQPNAVSVFFLPQRHVKRKGTSYTHSALFSVTAKASPSSIEEIMAATSSCITSTNFSSSISKSCSLGRPNGRKGKLLMRKINDLLSVKAGAGKEVKLVDVEEEEKQGGGGGGGSTGTKASPSPRPVDVQSNVESKNMSREYGGQWLSSTTRHVRIYAAYIDPETCAFDQTQMDKLTLMLDPTDEFLWTDQTCHKVYSYFQELVDHYEGAPLTEYTLRLIGSDIEHYIRKLLYKGEIQYNMNARVLNFSMGKPRIGFNYNNGQPQDINL